MKAISYSLFGYDREKHESCFDFNSYLRGMMISIRMNRLIYPNWINVIETDKATFTAFEKLFTYLIEKNIINLEINENGESLTKAMLWRLKPVFHKHPDYADKWKYTHVICRDLDSPVTYRERQAVEYWIAKDKAVHAITDSVSHTIPMMGGMIGIRPDYFTEKISQTWDGMFTNVNIDFSRKGADQDFLCTHIYPKFAQHGSDSITQHYFLGVGKSFLSDYHTCGCYSMSGHVDGCPEDYKIDLPDEMKESNNVVGHIGASGWYEPPLFRFLNKHWHRFNDLVFIEEQYPKNLFFWNWRDDLIQ